MDARAPLAADEQLCAVCWAAGRGERVEMPCCGVEGSTTWYCRRCIEIICENAPGGVGMCPIGCGPITIADGVVSKAQHVQAKCLLCLQVRQISRGGQLCAACQLGSQHALRYECDRCGRTQRIPHPMWRYQTDGPGPFGTSTWACHQGCGDYTHWRIIAADVANVPPVDAPPTWGQQGAWLAQVRDQRHNELRAAGALLAAPADQAAAPREESQCSLM